MRVPSSLRDTTEGDTVGMAAWNRADLIVASLLCQTLYTLYAM